MAPDGVDDVLLLPDRKWQKWVRSHPLGYGAHLSDVNSKHEDKVVRLVKLMKHWRDVHMVNRRPKSYWLEVLVVRHIRRGARTRSLAWQILPYRRPTAVRPLLADGRYASGWIAAAITAKLAWNAASVGAYWAHNLRQISRSVASQTAA